jgi:hypothetical protein
MVGNVTASCLRGGGGRDARCRPGSPGRMITRPRSPGCRRFWASGILGRNAGEVQRGALGLSMRSKDRPMQPGIPSSTTSIFMNLRTSISSLPHSITAPAQPRRAPAQAVLWAGY